MKTIDKSKVKINNNKATINFRTKANVKREANKIFDKMGLDMSTALNLFLHNVLLNKNNPLNLITENGYTVGYEREILKSAKDIKKSKSYSSLDEMWKDLNAD